MKNPKQVVTSYVEDVQARLGVPRVQQPWHMRDWSRKLGPRFGRCRGMWKIHSMLSEVLMVLLEGKSQLATALVVQLQKAVTQCAIDAGNWESAQLLWPFPDLQEVLPFGGEEGETT